MMKQCLTLCLILLPFQGHGAFSNNKPTWPHKPFELTLNNGMKFLLVNRGDTPVFSARITFRVGGMEEEKGKTGLAHMFEHMAFKGTKNLGTKDYEKEVPLMKAIDDLATLINKEYDNSNPEQLQQLQKQMTFLQEKHQALLNPGEFSKLMMERGGADLNATTSKDLTQYFVKLPADQLEFWATLESQRIFKPVLRQFYQERNVVLEERRMRVDDSPSGQLYELLIQNAFSEGPYQWSTIGNADDIRRLTRQDAQAFFERYYTPKNAVGTIVGNFDIRKAVRILKRTFGSIQPHPQGQLTRISSHTQKILPPKTNRVTIKHRAEPQLMIAFAKPTVPHHDDYVMDLIDQILSGGKTSRLYQALIKDKKIASSVTTYSSIPGSRLNNLLLVQAKPYGNAKIPAVETEIWNILEQLKTQPVTQKELDRARHKITADITWQMKSNESLASLLSYYESVVGTWEYLVDYPEVIQKITPQDIQEVAKRYFTKVNSITAVLEKL
jgi:predicted Zn-dependent peptidase